MYTVKKSAGAASSYKAINYFNHFPRQRLIPYGPIKEPTSDTSMLDKARSINCEYISRPKVALSEFADTVTSNKDRIKQMCINLYCHEIGAALDKLNDVLRNFNTRGDGTAVGKKDVDNLLRYLVKDDLETDEIFDRMEHLEMMLYVVGSHVKLCVEKRRNTVGNVDILLSKTNSKRILV